MKPVRLAAHAVRALVVLLIMSLGGLLAAGCASQSGGHADVAAAKPGASGGYVPPRRYETSTTQDTWSLNGGLVDVTLLAPAGSGVYPLVVYLPGLGEPSNAGSSWREAWARAGYAVLGVQPNRVGPAVWASSRARAGDFSGIASEAFSNATLATRVQMVGETLERLSRLQHDARFPAFAHIDLARVAVAGFDLGAQTALIVAGERLHGGEPMRFPDSVKSVIALSPYADRSASENDFASIRVPVISVTSSADSDAYGLIGSPSMRRTPFQYMPPGQKYLLVLANAAHGTLAGAEGLEPHGSKDAEDTFTADDQKILGDETAEIQEGPRKRRRRPDYSAARAERMAALSRVQSQVRAVTLAFLDAIIRNDAAAAEWLGGGAKVWLGNSAELISK